MLALRLLCTHFSFALIFLWATLTWSRRSLPIASRDDGAKVNENGKDLLRYLLLFSLSISSSSWSQIAVTFSLKKKKEKKKFYSELLIDRFRNSARKDITRVKELLSSTFNRRNDGGKYPVETEISFLPYRVYRESNGTSEFTRWNGIISGQQIKIGTVEISLIGSRSTLHVPCIDTGVASKFFFSFFFSLSTRCWNRVRTRERIFVGREIHPFGPTAKWFSPRGGGSRVNCTIANCPLHHFSSPSLPPPPLFF